MRGTLIGSVVILILVAIYGLRRLFRMKGDVDYGDLAGLVTGILIGGVVVGVPAILLVCRLFHLWPFSN